jgi:HEPN domain-containing protein
MTLPEIKSAEVCVWLEKAAHDIDAAEVDQREASDVPDFLWDVMFHCQQSVEKSLKGFLVWHDIKFKRTHDLAEIGTQCTDVDPTLALVVREAAPLSQYAWEFRYPGESDDPTVSQATEALQLARRVFQEILKRLPKETHPLLANKTKKNVKRSLVKKKKRPSKK